MIHKRREREGRITRQTEKNIALVNPSLLMTNLNANRLYILVKKNG